jgi:hypothetical protein
MKEGGHESVQTTEIYARADSAQKRDAIERAYVDVVKKEIPAWVENDNLLRSINRHASTPVFIREGRIHILWKKKAPFVSLAFAITDLEIIVDLAIP